MLAVIRNLMPATANDAEAPELTPREKLRAALRDVAAREGDLKRLRDADARVRSLIEAAVDAADAAKAAEVSAQQASEAWARSSPTTDGPPAEVQELARAARAARDHAVEQKMLADGARKALDASNTSEAVREAQQSLSTARGEVSRCVRAVILDELQPALNRVRQLRVEFAKALEPILTYSTATFMSADTNGILAKSGFGDLSEIIDDILLPPVAVQNWRNHRARGGYHGAEAERLEQYARRLAGDAEAQL